MIWQSSSANKAHRAASSPRAPPEMGTHSCSEFRLRPRHDQNIEGEFDEAKPSVSRTIWQFDPNVVAYAIATRATSVTAKLSSDGAYGVEGHAAVALTIWPTPGATAPIDWRGGAQFEPRDNSAQPEQDRPSSADDAHLPAYDYSASTVDATAACDQSGPGDVATEGAWSQDLRADAEQRYGSLVDSSSSSGTGAAEREAFGGSHNENDLRHASEHSQAEQNLSATRTAEGPADDPGNDPPSFAVNDEAASQHGSLPGSGLLATPDRSLFLVAPELSHGNAVAPPPVFRGEWGHVNVPRPATVPIYVDAFATAGGDDADAIEAALGVLSSAGGGVLMFTARSYVLSRTVDVTSNVLLSGNGATITWPDKGSAYSFFRVENASSVAIEDFTFQWRARDTSAATVQTHAVVIESSSLVEVTGSRFFDSKAINIVSSDHVNIFNNDFLRGLEGIVVGALTNDATNEALQSENIFIHHNHFQGQRREAIDLNSNVDGVLVLRNTFVGGDQARLVFLETDELIDIGGANNVRVEGNSFNGAGTYAVAIRGKLGSEDLKISNNLFTGFVAESNLGVLDFLDADFQVQANVIVAPGQAILMRGHNSGTISGNQIDSRSGEFIRANGLGSEGVSIGSNELTRGSLSNVSIASREIGFGSRISYGKVWSETVAGSSGDDTLIGDGGDDRLLGQGGRDTILGGDGNDTLDGGLGDDNLLGGAGNDSLLGGEGNDLIWGDEGNDLLEGGPGVDSLFGGDGLDTLRGGADADSLTGDAGNDLLMGGTGADTLDGGDGDDILDGEDHADKLYGGKGADTLNGGNGDDLLSGGDGNDSLVGGVGTDTLIGGEGNDRLDGGLGADSMVGGVGDDTYIVEDIGDLTVELSGEGYDRVFASISYTLAAEVERLSLAGTTNLNGKGNALANRLDGNAGANSLDGGEGDDSLYGLGGDDTLIGGAGADFLDGGSGADRLAGGLGGDRFYFGSAGEAHRDVIVDFSATQGDRINLLAIDANSRLAGDQAFAWIGSAAFGGLAGQLRFESGMLEGDVDGDGTADFQIGVTGVASLTSASFWL